MGADQAFAEMMRVRTKTVPTPEGPRKLWRAIVKGGAQNGVGAMTRSEIEWHSAECVAPRNDCHGCEPA